MSNRKPIEVRDLSKIAVFAAIIAVLGLPGTIPLFGGAVPISAQTLGVMLAGAVLGPWRGAVAVIVFELLVAAGLPLLAGGRGGLGVFVGPTVGFLIGWIVGAIVIGLIVRAHLGKPSVVRTVLGFILGGIVAIYAFGIPFMALILGISFTEALVGASVFLIGDGRKVVIATVVTLALYRAYPKAFAN